MFEEIPLAENCEINELKWDFFTDPNVPLEDDFTIIKKKKSVFCWCDPDVTIALCKNLFNNNQLVQPLIDFNYPDIDYWFFCRYKFGISSAEETPFSDIFNLYLEFGFIKKIQHEAFMDFTSEGKGYIYVYSVLYFKISSVFFVKLAKMAKKKLLLT